MRYGSLRDTIVGAVKRAVGSFASLFSGAVPGAGTEFFWALKDISFEVAEGEVVGVIGKNGAGKSTLLKVLSRITEPTEGTATLKGRLGSLLEVGTGFHPELTGRENVYLSGAILGMKRREIDAKFDEIIEFSGIEKFIDTPAKRYSSGMYVRLGFAVAAHLDPEILFIDEVLAVGDAQFQKKCIGKMNDIAGSGRTILFVSHNMAAVSSLCSRVIVIDEGRIVFNGDTEEGIAKYLETYGTASAEVTFDKSTERKGEGPVRFTSFRIESGKGDTVSSVSTGGQLDFVLEYESSEPLSTHSVVATIGVNRQIGTDLFTLMSSVAGADFSNMPPRGSLRCSIEKLPVASGNFPVSLMLEVDGRISDWIVGAANLEVVAGDFYGSGKTLPQSRNPILVEHTWLAAAPETEA